MKEGKQNIIENIKNFSIKFLDFLFQEPKIFILQSWP